MIHEIQLTENDSLLLPTYFTTKFELVFALIQENVNF